MKSTLNWDKPRATKKTLKSYSCLFTASFTVYCRQEEEEEEEQRDFRILIKKSLY
jgi:hypothetical protein